MVNEPTDKQAAIAALITAIEAGSWDQSNAWKALGIGKTGRAERAFDGSLDAALALHDALLPGWDVICLDQASNLAGSPWGCELGSFDGSNPGNNRKVYSGHNFDRAPARAWLLAILKAYAAQLAEVS